MQDRREEKPTAFQVAVAALTVVSYNNGVLFRRQVQLTHFYLLAGVGVN